MLLVSMANSINPYPILYSLYFTYQGGGRAKISKGTYILITNTIQSNPQHLLDNRIQVIIVYWLLVIGYPTTVGSLTISKAVVRTTFDAIIIIGLNFNSMSSRYLPSRSSPEYPAYVLQSGTGSFLSNFQYSPYL